MLGFFKKKILALFSLTLLFTQGVKADIEVQLLLGSSLDTATVVPHESSLRSGESMRDYIIRIAKRYLINNVTGYPYYFDGSSGDASSRYPVDDPYKKSHTPSFFIKVKTSEFDKINKDEKLIASQTSRKVATSDNSDLNMQSFGSGFSQKSYDTDGFLFGKISMYGQGLSKAYIVRTYIVRDKTENSGTNTQSYYRIYEFKRINFLEEFANIAYKYYKDTGSLPIFMTSPMEYLSEYVKTMFEGADKRISGFGDRIKKFDNSLASEISANMNDIFQSYSPTSNTKAGLDVIDKISPNASKDEMIEVFKDWFRSFDGSRGGGTKLFLNEGKDINYAVLNADADPNDKIQNMDYTTTLYFHSAMMSTIMTKYNIREGLISVDGLPSFGSNLDSNGLDSSPFSFIATYRKERPCCIKIFGKCVTKKDRHLFHGKVTHDPEMIFSIRASDYINYGISRASNIMVGDPLTDRLAVSTLLPFSTPAGDLTSVQGHMLNHIVSFQGYGNGYGGVSTPDLTATPKRPKIADDVNTISYGYTSAFNGEMPSANNALYSSIGIYKGDTHKKEGSRSQCFWRIFFTVLAVALVGAAPFAVASLAALAISGLATVSVFTAAGLSIVAWNFVFGLGLGALVWNLLAPSSPKLISNINSSSFTQNYSPITLSTYFNSTNIIGNFNSELYDKLIYSSVYNELFLTSNVENQKRYLVHPVFTKKIMEKGGTGRGQELMKVEVGNTPAEEIYSKLHTADYYERVFKHDNPVRAMITQRYNNDLALIRAISEYFGYGILQDSSTNPVLYKQYEQK